MTEPDILTPDDVFQLQRMVGNRAVENLLQAGPTKNRPEQATNQPQVSPRERELKPAGPPIQRTLTSKAERAFNSAITQNAGYSSAKTQTDENVPASDQKSIVKLRGRWASMKASPKQEKDLKDYIRAFLLKAYAQRLTTLKTNVRFPTKKAKEKRRKFYLSKALEVRDQYKTLVDKGVTAPETQTFLKTEGFGGGFDLKPQELDQGPRIDVRATFIGGKILGKRVRAHLFIVYTSSTGQQWYFRGGPDGSDPSLTVADMGEYTPDTVDWDPSAPSVTVLDGQSAQAKLDALMEATSVIDGMQVPYDPGGVFKDGENCNATAYTILDRAGVPKNKPSGRHPGWGHILGALTEGKQDALPAKETDTGPGETYQIKGPTSNQVQIFKDRGLLEKAENLAGLTQVKVLAYLSGQLAKIKYNEDTIGFVDKDMLEAPRGRPFRIGLYTENIFKLDSDQLTGHSLDMGDVVDVLDPDFEPGSTAGNLVKIAYNVGDERFAGRLQDWDLGAEAEEFKPENPSDFPAQGRHFVTMKAGQTLSVAKKEEDPLNETLKFEKETRLKVVILDDMTTKYGRCRVDYNGQAYYPRLKALFGN